MTRLALGVAAAFALTGCAVSNTSYPRPPVNYAPSAPNHFTAAPRAPVHSEVFVCNTWSSNLGVIGQRGEVSNYRPYMDTPAGPLLRMPTEAACFSSGFGWRGDNAGGRHHNGVDLANPSGGYVFAAGDGWVRFAGQRGGFGLVLEIDHGHGVVTRYAHLFEIDPNLREGMHVAAGAAVARMGMSGNATGVHLHYEVSVDGLLVDPMRYGAPQVYVTTPVIDASPTDAPEF